MSGVLGVFYQKCIHKLSCCMFAQGSLTSYLNMLVFDDDMRFFMKASA